MHPGTTPDVFILPAYNLFTRGSITLIFAQLLNHINHCYECIS
jgi:hypothetical protein